jgi:Na+/H+-translocating membrane pyrophosphatase
MEILAGETQMRTSGRLRRPLSDAHAAAMLRLRIAGLVVAGVCVAICTTMLGGAWWTMGR